MTADDAQMGETTTPSTPFSFRKRTQAELLESLQALVRASHSTAHANSTNLDKPLTPRGHELVELLHGLLDCADWLVNSYSWDHGNLKSFDRTQLREKLQECVMWRIV